MKRTIIILTAVLCLLLCCGCQKTELAETEPERTQEEQTVGEEIKTDDAVEEPDDDAIDDEEGVFVDPIDTVAFSSLEEFNEAIYNAPEDDDIADLAHLDVYYLPTSLPDGYELYKIVAGSYDIGFWYLPEECLNSEAEAAGAEVQGKDFLFISGRGEVFSEIMKQFGKTELIDDTYIVKKGTRDLVVWEVDGTALMLYIPRVETEYYTPNGNNDYADLIKTEAVYIER